MEDRPVEQAAESPGGPASARGWWWDGRQTVASRRRWWTWALLGLTLLGLWAILLFQSDWRVTDRLLGSAMADLRATRAAFEEGDLDQARDDAGRAAVRTRAARSRIDGPLWWLLGRTSQYGPNLRTVQHLVATAHAAAAAVVLGSCDGLGDLATAAADLRGNARDGVDPSLALAREELLDLSGVLDVEVASRAGCP
jgi:hypothetical protein